MTAGKKISFVGWVTFIMPTWDYDVYFKKLKCMSRYLFHPKKVIIYCNIYRPWPIICSWFFISVWKTSHICALFRLKFERYKPILYRHLPIPVSSLAFDITFNLGEFKFSQTTYKNVSLYKKGTVSHPSFPGLILVHR